MADKLDIPKHIGIIMDGNGRWADKNNRPRIFGHTKGVSATRKTIRFCLDKKIQYLTLYAFSTENWKRPDSEIDYLMGLIHKFIDKEKVTFQKKGIRLHWIGRRDRVDQSIRDKIEEVEELTKSNTNLDLALAFDYGSRDEIIKACREIALKVKAGHISPENIDDVVLNNELYTKDFPDVDLIIRSSGEQRISNFLLWQSAYAEFYFTETHWPEINAKELEKALEVFAGRKRRMGGL